MTYQELYLRNYEEAKTRTCCHGNVEAFCPSSMCHIWTPEEMDLDPEAEVPAEMMPLNVKALTAYDKQEIRDTLALMAEPYQMGFVRWYIGVLREGPVEPEPTIFLH